MARLVLLFFKSPASLEHPVDDRKHELRDHLKTGLQYCTEVAARFMNTYSIFAALHTFCSTPERSRSKCNQVVNHCVPPTIQPQQNCDPAVNSNLTTAVVIPWINAKMKF